MTKQEHPVEAHEREVISRAVYFTAFIQVRPGYRLNERCETRDAAEGLAQKFADDHGRRALVYAVDDRNLQALVATRSPQEKDPSPMQTDNPTYSAKSAAIRAARATLGESAKAGIAFTLAENAGRWSWAPLLKLKGVTRIGGGAPATDIPAPSKPPPPPPPRNAPPAPDEEPAPQRMRKSTAEAIEAAKRGILPTPPDFSAETHTRFRPKLAELTALIEKRDIAGLKAYPINPISTSPKALDRYRNLAVAALEAQLVGSEIL